MNKVFFSFKEIFNNPIESIFIIINIILIESLLSIDNAVILATLIKKNKKKDQKKALKYGIIGACFFRIISLIFIYSLINIWWLKSLGGIYLIYLGYNHFFYKKNNKKNNFFKKKIFNNFWFKIIYIELIDLIFSIDNIFASIAYSKNIIIIFLGILIGMLIIRFIIKKFIKLMNKIPSLEDSTFLIIILLGLKLFFSILEKFFPYIIFVKIIKNNFIEFFFSFLTIIIFFLPIFFFFKKNVKVT
jgi:YkoY family integral membrane protein